MHLALAFVSAAAAPSLSAMSEAFEAITKDAAPAVVEILASGYGVADVVTQTNLLTNRKGLGSGVILSEDGYIVTNFHVVDGSSRFEVRLPRRRTGSILGS